MLSRRLVFNTVFSFFVVGCTTLSGSSSWFTPTDSTRSRSSYQAQSERGMVSAAHPIASRAGEIMLARGGNAVDAAVAASFAISVVRPQSTGIGGGGFLLFHEKARSKTSVYDFRERAPLRSSRNMYLDQQGNVKPTKYRGQTIEAPSQDGHLAVATPGLVAGLVELHAKHGRLPLATVLSPAIDAAERGFTVYGALADAIERRKTTLQKFEATRKLLFPEGRQLRAGDHFIQTDLARTLRLIAAQGRDGFYKGQVAQRILAEMKRGQGILTQQDLDQYRVITRTPVTGEYRGHRVIGMPPPSSGGLHIVQMLNMLKADNLRSLGHNSVESIHLITEVMRRAFADRAVYLGDPDFVRVPMAGLLNPRYALALRQGIDLKKATPSSSIRKGVTGAPESPSTTHISVVDQFGNAVSTTQTINYTFGSGVVAAGTGVFLNNEMDDFSIKPGLPNVFGLVGGEANAIAPKKTMLSSMSPTIVLDRNNNVRLVVGSPGGPRIINATLQAIINVIDHGMTLSDAVHAYRFHHQWLPDELFIETKGFSNQVLSELKARGHTVTTTDQIGDVQAIAREGRQWIGVSDTRSDGVPYGLK